MFIESEFIIVYSELIIQPKEFNMYLNMRYIKNTLVDLKSRLEKFGLLPWIFAT